LVILSAAAIMRPTLSQCYKYASLGNKIAQTPYKDRKRLLPDNILSFIAAFQRKSEKSLQNFDRNLKSYHLTVKPDVVLTGSLFFGALKSLKIQSGIFSGMKSSDNLDFFRKENRMTNMRFLT